MVDGWSGGGGGGGGGGGSGGVVEVSGAAGALERGKRPASQESDDALRERQELETWNREASREDLGGWASAKDLDQTWEKEKENWGQDEDKATVATGSRSEGLGPGQNLEGRAAGGESAATGGAGGGADASVGELDKAARTASEAAARARSSVGGSGGGGQDYSGRRNVGAGGGGSGGGGGGYQGGSMSSGTGSGAPCGACKFLRRKCVRGCIFAPYFGAEQGAAKFAAVHKVFGASNVAKLLLHIPAPRRSDAVLTISYEAQARLSDPVYGCVATIFALQQQVSAALGPHSITHVFIPLIIREYSSPHQVAGSQLLPDQTLVVPQT